MEVVFEQNVPRPKPFEIITRSACSRRSPENLASREFRTARRRRFYLSRQGRLKSRTSFQGVRPAVQHGRCARAADSFKFYLIRGQTKTASLPRRRRCVTYLRGRKQNCRTGPDAHKYHRRPLHSTKARNSQPESIRTFLSDLPEKPTSFMF